MWSIRIQNFDLHGLAEVFFTPISNQELLEKLNFSEGDILLVTETEQGLSWSPCDPEFEEAMTIYQEGRQKFRQALRELVQ